MKPTNLKQMHYQLVFAKLTLGKGNVAGWWRSISTSNEVATGELTDDSSFLVRDQSLSKITSILQISVTNFKFLLNFMQISYFRPFCISNFMVNFIEILFI